MQTGQMEATQNPPDNTTKIRRPKNQHRRLHVLVLTRLCLWPHMDRLWAHRQANTSQLFYQTREKIAQTNSFFFLCPTCCPLWMDLLNALDLCSCAKELIGNANAAPAASSCRPLRVLKDSSQEMISCSIRNLKETDSKVPSSRRMSGKDPAERDWTRRTSTCPVFMIFFFFFLDSGHKKPKTPRVAKTRPTLVNIFWGGRTGKQMAVAFCQAAVWRKLKGQMMKTHTKKGKQTNHKWKIRRDTQVCERRIDAIFSRHGENESGRPNRSSRASHEGKHQ